MQVAIMEGTIQDLKERLGQATEENLQLNKRLDMITRGEARVLTSRVVDIMDRELDQYSVNSDVWNAIRELKYGLLRFLRGK